MITICPLCSVDTAGNHEMNCPNKPQETVVLGQAAPLQAQQILDECPYTACKGKQFQAELDMAKEENKRLREAIEAAIRLKDLWLFITSDPEHIAESVALGAMLYKFKQALKGE